MNNLLQKLTFFKPTYTFNNLMLSIRNFTIISRHLEEIYNIQFNDGYGNCFEFSFDDKANLSVRLENIFIDMQDFRYGHDFDIEEARITKDLIVAELRQILPVSAYVVFKSRVHYDDYDKFEDFEETTLFTEYIDIPVKYTREKDFPKNSTVRLNADYEDLSIFNKDGYFDGVDIVEAEPFYKRFLPAFIEPDKGYANLTD